MARTRNNTTFRLDFRTIDGDANVVARHSTNTRLYYLHLKKKMAACVRRYRLNEKYCHLKILANYYYY